MNFVSIKCYCVVPNNFEKLVACSKRVIKYQSWEYQKLKITHSIMNDHQKNKKFTINTERACFYCLKMCLALIVFDHRNNNVRNIITHYIEEIIIHCRVYLQF